MPSLQQNKHTCQLCIGVLQQLYPDQWPNFFTDMLAARRHNAAHANMFTRVLLALDADIISLDIPRSDAESRRSMAFKDAMRVCDVGPVVHACVELVRQQHRENPELVMLVLGVLQRYADWVDIHLVVTQEFLSLLYELLRGARSDIMFRLILCMSLFSCMHLATGWIEQDRLNSIQRAHQLFKS
jgi:exportin-T